MSAIPLVDPAPPPTLNNLDPHQRTRLLRSARKLESLLGTTPYLLEPSSTSARLHTGSPTSTTTSSNAKRAHHHERRTLQDNLSPSSRSSKHDTDRSDFLAKRAHAHMSSEKPTFELVPDISPKLEPPSYNEKRSRLLKKNSLNKGSQGKPISTQGINVAKPQSRDKTLDSKPNKETHSIPFSHPLVLSLLSIPVPYHDGHTTPSLPSASSSTSHSPSSAKPSSLHSTSSLSPPTFATNPDSQTLALPSTPTTPGLLTPLTPLSPTFCSNQLDSSEREKERERDARRKKVAKLTRTLGENVPPELVFHTTIVKKDRDLHAKNLASQSNPTITPRSGSQSQHRSQSIQIIPVPRGPSSLNHKQKSLPASGPPIVIIGPPPTPGAHKKRKSPPSPQTQNAQTEAHPSAEFIIPPAPSTPAPLPPAILVEKYRLERQKARDVLEKSQSSSTPTLGNTKTYTHRPRSLSLGSGIDLLTKYWAREVEVGDGKPGSGGSGSGGKVDGRETIGVAEPSAASAAEEGSTNPSPYRIQFPSRPSPTTQHHTVYRTHRHVYSTPSPREPYFITPHENPMPPANSAPMSNLFPTLLQRKSSKSKVKTALYTKAGVERSHSVKSKNSGGVEVEVVTSVESDEGVVQHGVGRTRSKTLRPSNGNRTSGLLGPPPACGKRREREWSGAWNRTDMGEVVKGLRGLKSR